MKDLRTESQKFLHSFITITIIVISLTLISMGIFAAKNNTAMIDSGVSPAMIYARRKSAQISVQIGESLYQNQQPKEFPLTQVAKFAPVPINGIYIIYENICEIAKN